MKATLISPYPDVTSFGLRTISSYLRDHGHKTRLIFLPDPLGDDLKAGGERYTDEAMEELVPLCADSDLVGISLMTNYFDNAVRITEKLKGKIRAPILWGGVHPTIRPEECLQFADMVCVGEGEEAILDVMEAIESGADCSGISNIWVKADGNIRKNTARPLTQDLDGFPVPDYSLEDHHILTHGHIEPFTQDLLRSALSRGTLSIELDRIGYQTLTGRGCPHRCTYCINDALKGIYGTKSFLRWRSVSHIIDELSLAKERMPYIGYIWISDDAFFARDLKSIEEFCTQYKERIALPFSCLASPVTISDEKMALLIDAGLIYVQMGIQTGSRRMQELFNREQMTNERMMRAIGIIHKYKERMLPPSYDFILDVPYEENRDRIESIAFISRIPKPFRLQPFALVPYPGTKLHRMAKADGLIRDEVREVYTKSYTMREPTYFNLLITLAKGGRFPGPLLRLCISGPVVAVFDSKLLRPVVGWAFRTMKKVYSEIKKALRLQTKARSEVASRYRGECKR